MFYIYKINSVTKNFTQKRFLKGSIKMKLLILCHDLFIIDGIIEDGKWNERWILRLITILRYLLCRDFPLLLKLVKCESDSRTYWGFDITETNPQYYLIIVIVLCGVVKFCDVWTYFDFSSNLQFLGFSWVCTILE